MVSFKEISRQARLRFGVKQFWPGQVELIQHAIAGRNAIGILPTGGGKSLCYQLPAPFGRASSFQSIGKETGAPGRARTE